MNRDTGREGSKAAMQALHWKLQFNPRHLSIMQGVASQALAYWIFTKAKKYEDTQSCIRDIDLAVFKIKFRHCPVRSWAGD